MLALRASCSDARTSPPCRGLGDAPLKHKPFSALCGAVVEARSSKPEPPAVQTQQPLDRVILREEVDATEGNLARLIGLPVERLDSIGKQIRWALEFPLMIEGRDVLVVSDEQERIASWVRAEGAEVVVVRHPAAVDLARRGVPRGTIRAQIRRGLRGAVVQKAEQGTGTLTEGVVRDIFTSSAEHHRGIKVRLESGEVGCVQRILGG